MFKLALWHTGSPGDSGDRWGDHGTLIVGVVGILFSGLIGPTVVAYWTGRRERQRDGREAIGRQREDLRQIVDEVADVLSNALPKLRPLISAQLAGQSLPDGPKDFLSALGPLGDRLRLRLAEKDPVVVAYDEARAQLVVVSETITTRAAFDSAADTFVTKRDAFLDAARSAVLAPIDKKGRA